MRLEHQLFFSLIFSFCLFFHPAYPFPANWRDYVAKEMIDRYIGTGFSTAYSSNNFQGDISGVDRSASQNGLFNAINDQEKRWPDGIVPYNISSTFSDEERVRIDIAIKQVSSSTSGCVKFILRTTEKDYVQIVRGLDCHSSIGRQGGQQIVSYTRGCMEEVGSIQHELMHAIGFFHEISRVDRDKYVWINFKNILPSFSEDFKIETTALTFGLPYDYESVLHYAFNAFAINESLPTIVPKQKGMRIGQSEGLSLGDIMKLRKMYKCSANTASASDETIDMQITDSSPILDDFEPTTSWTEPTSIVSITAQTLAKLDNQCTSLDTDKCKVSEPSEGCTLDFLNVICEDGAEVSEAMETLQNIASRTQTGHPVVVTLKGQMDLTQDVFKPIKDDLYVLSIANDAASLSSISLRNLLQLTLTDISSLKLTKKDLGGFPKLKILDLERTSLLSIEKNAFAQLQNLELIAFEHGMDFPTEREQFSNMKRIHCDCHYSWLRQYLIDNPTLLSPKRKGSVYTVGSLQSAAYHRSDIFLPVDCSQPLLEGKSNQQEFSINERCSTQTSNTKDNTNVGGVSANQNSWNSNTNLNPVVGGNIFHPGQQRGMQWTSINGVMSGMNQPGLGMSTGFGGGTFGGGSNGFRFGSGGFSGGGFSVVG